MRSNIILNRTGVILLTLGWILFLVLHIPLPINIPSAWYRIVPALLDWIRNAGFITLLALTTHWIRKKHKYSW